METCALFFDVSVQARKMQSPLWKEIAQLVERCLIAEVVGPNPILFLFFYSRIECWREKRIALYGRMSSEERKEKCYYGKTSKDEL